MVVDPVTGLTPAEEKAIKDKLTPFYAKHKISTIYQGPYWAFASISAKKSTQEAQIELNKWNTRGLNKTYLLEIAKNVLNKNLV